MVETNANIDSWDDFLGNWFKVDHIKTWPASVIVVDVKGTIDDDDVGTLVLSIQYNTKKFKYQPNKTNIGILKDAKIPSPRALIGKKLIFKEVLNFNPNLKKKVPSLEIEKIE